MKHLPIISFTLIVLMGSCGQVEDKTAVAPKTDSIVLVKAKDTLSSMNKHSDTLTKKFIEDTLMTIKEVKQKNDFIDSLTNHKHGISFMIDKPNIENKAYYIAVGYNKKLRFETFYNFYINPTNKQITIDDAFSGERLTLDAWRKTENYSLGK